MEKKIGKNAALAVLSQIPIASAFGKFFEDFVQEGWQEDNVAGLQQYQSLQGTEGLAQDKTDSHQKITT